MQEEYNRDAGLRYLQRGIAFERSNRIAEAVDAYRQAIASNPHLSEAHNALGFYYQRSGLLAKAAEEFRTVANLSGDFLAYFNLGYILVELERYEDALTIFQHCLSLDPADPATHFEIALITYILGDFQTALAHLQRPLQSYPADWEIYNLLGKTYLGLRDYDQAMTAFGRALLLANGPQAQVELLDNINAVERYREFRHLTTVKDHLYAQEGVVYLGSAQDDGLHMSETQDFHFSYADIGTTLQRLIALIKSADLNLSAIVCADTLSRPLADALAEFLTLPQREVDQLVAEDRALFLIAVGREAELMLLTLERITCPTITFCLALNWLRHNKALPDLIGITAHGRCSVPWESELRHLRASGAPAELIQAGLKIAAQRVLEAIHATPIDPNLPRQIRYYTRTHRKFLANPE
ncbi:TPR repeat-containing protein [Oscillochloris trichoides DG-6]|uniref:TPR repeat-containing protein n=1 Tax=Oscillochloris trichoides DG-6 TaxID=765420 RepID=E1IHJ5_9CHLR|nr:tetratricopeptide repeat protein [Oscillochloris trichoides]EFO79358.1 TPR repeat-containing protein [Oscillochloris trichoides DG-6]